ncbi:hypothetical protein, partial [Cognatilysobacter terrigena]|uniref:hypothetical protein n=1 Tax=Cognatilysobacter terrigena TaxID=2488749 RepID=UPI001AACBDEB
MKQIRVLWLLGGFIVAPAIPPLVLSCRDILSGTDQSLSVFLAISLVTYAFSAPIVAAIGLPALLLARRLRLDRWWIAALFGAVCGAAVSFTFYSQDPPSSAILKFAAWGLSIAWLVWLSWRLGEKHEARLAANNSSKPTP